MIATFFAGLALYSADPKQSKQNFALTAVGLQMAIEVTRHFDYAVRWSVNLETEMVSIQRLLAYTHIKQERTGIEQDSRTII